MLQSKYAVAFISILALNGCKMFSYNLVSNADKFPESITIDERGIIPRSISFNNLNNTIYIVAEGNVSHDLRHSYPVSKEEYGSILKVNTDGTTVQVHEGDENDKLTLPRGSYFDPISSRLYVCNKYIFSFTTENTTAVYSYNITSYHIVNQHINLDRKWDMPIENSKSEACQGMTKFGNELLISSPNVNNTANQSNNAVYCIDLNSPAREAKAWIDYKRISSTEFKDAESGVQAILTKRNFVYFLGSELKDELYRIFYSSNDLGTSEKVSVITDVNNSYTTKDLYPQDIQYGYNGNIYMLYSSQKQAYNNDQPTPDTTTIDGVTQKNTCYLYKVSEKYYPELWVKSFVAKISSRPGNICSSFIALSNIDIAYAITYSQAQEHPLVFNKIHDLNI